MPRLRSLWLSLSAVSERLRESRTLAVASDFDGTLNAIVAHPDQVSLPERTRLVLRRLADLPQAGLAVLSGRGLEDLERHLDGRGLFLAGAAGLETRDEAGRREVHLPADARLPEALQSDLETWCERFPGAWMEDKRFSCALHYRAVSPALQPAFGAGVRRRVRPYREQARLVHGKRVFEVMPAIAWEKSAALRRWLAGREGTAVTFYFGDDTNDEPVHRLVRETGGISVTVGRPVSAAEFQLPSPVEVVWFLEWLEREWAALHAGAHEQPDRESARA